MWLGLEKGKEIVCCLPEEFILSNLRKRNRGREPLDSDTVPGGLGGREKDFIALIVLE